VALRRCGAPIVPGQGLKEVVDPPARAGRHKPTRRFGSCCSVADGPEPSPRIGSESPVAFALRGSPYELTGVGAVQAFERAALESRAIEVLLLPIRRPLGSGGTVVV